MAGALSAMIAAAFSGSGGSVPGSSSTNPANSAAQIKTLNPSAASGVYWILVNGSAKQVYCDMTNDGGGWMLWQTFGASAAFQAGNAILPTNINSTQFTANGLTTNVGVGFGTDNISFNAPCNNVGYVRSNSIGATLAITPTLLRTQFANIHSTGTAYLATNGTQRATDSPGGGPTIATSVPVNFSGTQPVIEVYEDNAIAALYWIMLK